MSFLTTIIVAFPSTEEATIRMQEVCEFKIRGHSIDFISVNSSFVLDNDSGNKDFRTLSIGNVYMQTFNHINVIEFLEFFSNNVRWESPEYVQVFIRNENEWTFSLYAFAGSKIVYKAEEQ